MIARISGDASKAKQISVEGILKSSGADAHHTDAPRVISAEYIKRRGRLSPAPPRV
jgi:hypothetical protein